MKGGSFKKVLNQTYFGVFSILRKKYDRQLLNACYSKYIVIWSLLLTIFFLNLRDLRILTWTSASKIRSLDEVFKDGSWTSFDDTPKSTGDSNNPPTRSGSFIPRYFECSPGAKKTHVNEDYFFITKAMVS